MDTWENHKVSKRSVPSQTKWKEASKLLLAWSKAEKVTQMQTWAFFFFFNGQGGWLRGQSYWEKWNRKSHPKNWAILKKHSLSLDLTELICSQLDFSMAIKQWLLSTSHFPSFECPGLLPEILTQSSLSHHRVLEGEDAQRFYQSIERGLLRPLYWDLLRGLLRETKSLN